MILSPIQLPRARSLTGLALLAFVVALVVTMAAVAAAEPAPGSKASLANPLAQMPPERKGPIPNRYIVVLKDSVAKPGRVAERHSDNRGAQVKQVYRSALSGYSARIAKGELAAVKADPAVAYVERDHWGGIASQDTPTGIDRIFATANAALQINEEDDLRVDADIAIIDTGVAEHPDLDLVSHVNCSGQPCAAGGTDGNGHGTHVAGTAAAIDNGYGVVGVAPGARIWGVKVLNNAGSGLLSELIAGIDWVTANAAEIEVANSSLRYWGVEESEAFEEAIEASMAAGVVHVVAAGNESEEVRYVPGNHPDVITVSALADFDGAPGGLGADECTWWGDVDDTLADFSNYGGVVDLAAPGVCILSTIPGGSYGLNHGTSMASPHVAGAAAILATEGKPETSGDVKKIRDKLRGAGNFNWQDTSKDGAHEPLLDVSNIPPPPPGPWSLHWPPNLSEEEGSEQYLTDVSCFSDEDCLAVGAYDHSEGAGVLTGGWDGTNWSIASDFEADRLNGVTCPSATACFGVGSDDDDALVALWLDPAEKWEAFPAVSPAEATSAELSAISCGIDGGGYCVAVGSYTESGQKRTLALRLNPNTGKFETDATPNEGEDENALSAVSCDAADSCVAVGHYLSGEKNPLAMRWNGEEWSLESLPSPESEGADAHLEGVSCTGEGGASTRCMAVGVHEDVASEEAIALGFDGEEWTDRPPPSSGAGASNALRSVACVAADNCVAVGAVTQSAVPSPFAIRWDGEEWDIKNPDDPSGGQGAALSGVACTGSIHCVAVGDYQADGATLTLAAEYNEKIEPPEEPEPSLPPTVNTKAVIFPFFGYATLRGAVNPNESETTYQFVYGTSPTKYDHIVPVTPKGIGAGSSDVQVSETINDLEPGVTYHYRLIATNSGGVSVSENKSFSTAVHPSFPHWDVEADNWAEVVLTDDMDQYCGLEVECRFEDDPQSISIFSETGYPETPWEDKCKIDFGDSALHYYGIIEAHETEWWTVWNSLEFWSGYCTAYTPLPNLLGVACMHKPSGEVWFQLESYKGVGTDVVYGQLVSDEGGDTEISINSFNTLGPKVRWDTGNDGIDLEPALEAAEGEGECGWPDLA